MISRRIIYWAVALGLALPIVVMVLAGVGRLLGVMDDGDGAALLSRLAMLAGVLWLLDLVGLVLLLAVKSLEPPQE